MTVEMEKIIRTVQDVKVPEIATAEFKSIEIPILIGEKTLVLKVEGAELKRIIWERCVRAEGEQTLSAGKDNVVSLRGML